MDKFDSAKQNRDVLRARRDANPKFHTGHEGRTEVMSKEQLEKQWEKERHERRDKRERHHRELEEKRTQERERRHRERAPKA